MSIIIDGIDFEKKYSDEFLDEDARVGNYLDELLYKYEKNQATVKSITKTNLKSIMLN